MYEREPDNASDRYTVAVIGKSIPDMEMGQDISEVQIDNKIVTSVHSWVSRL